MPINDYTEKDIRNAIVRKIRPKINPGKHDKGSIYVDGKLEAKVKIPNNHMRIMKPKKSQYIATALKLSNDDFNDLIDCPLTGPNYYRLLEKRAKSNI